VLFDVGDACYMQQARAKIIRDAGTDLAYLSYDFGRYYYLI
jgi:hypothetical protein